MSNSHESQFNSSELFIPRTGQSASPSQTQRFDTHRFPSAHLNSSEAHNFESPVTITRIAQTFTDKLLERNHI